MRSAGCWLSTAVSSPAGPSCDAPRTILPTSTPHGLFLQSSQHSNSFTSRFRHYLSVKCLPACVTPTSKAASGSPGTAG